MYCNVLERAPWTAAELIAHYCFLVVGAAERSVQEWIFPILGNEVLDMQNSGSESAVPFVQMCFL